MMMSSNTYVSRYGGRAHFGMDQETRTSNLCSVQNLSSGCVAISLGISLVKQRNVCGCGLASLEMVLRHYGAGDNQLDFLADRRISRQAESLSRGLSEGILGTLALKRGFEVTIHGESPRLAKTFFKLGGRVKRTKTSKQTILDCLRRRIPPIVLIPSVRDAYLLETEETSHYVVVTGVDRRCRLLVADPEYDQHPRPEYWNYWSSSLIEVFPQYTEPNRSERHGTNGFTDASIQ